MIVIKFIGYIPVVHVHGYKIDHLQTLNYPQMLFHDTYQIAEESSPDLQPFSEILL